MRKNLKHPSPELLARIIADRKVRGEITRKSHYWFFHVYFHEYVTYKTAPFQRELFSLTEDSSIDTLAVVAFRGSGKTTIMTLSYPLWAILGMQQKKHILILTQTMPQAKQLLRNIRTELEENQILRNDLGPFRDEDEWHSYSLVLTRYKARITVASSEQSVRGTKHGPHRPDLVILDDIEDIQSVKTRESRNKTYDWVTGDIIPIGSTNTRFIFIGNLLHEDSLLMRIKEKIALKKMDGIYKEYPLLDSKRRIMWPGKYKSMHDIEKEKRKIGSEIAWQREYMLRIISDEERAVHPEWLHYYEGLPSLSSDDFRFTAAGVDLAISEKSYADYTALVFARVYGEEEDLRIMILPNVINKRMDFPTTVETIKMLANSSQTEIKFYIESVGYQESLAQRLRQINIDAEGVKVYGDKRARLVSITNLIRDGKILFPKRGAEKLIQQLTGFGVEKHDDLVDAFTMLIHKVIEEDRKLPRITVIETEISE